MLAVVVFLFRLPLLAKSIPPFVAWRSQFSAAVSPPAQRLKSLAGKPAFRLVVPDAKQLPPSLPHASFRTGTRRSRPCIGTPAGSRRPVRVARLLWRSCSGTSETAGTALGFAQLGNDIELYLLHRHDHGLGYAVAMPHRQRTING